MLKKGYNNCFKSKQHNTTLCRAKTGKHECGKIAAMYKTGEMVEFK